MGILFIDLTEHGGVGEGAYEALQKRTGAGPVLRLKLEKEAINFRDTRILPNFQLPPLTAAVDEIIIGNSWNDRRCGVLLCRRSYWWR